MPFARLADRSTLVVSGEPAEEFLQNLVTADIPTIPPGEARPSALLTPQGKILFDFLVSRTEAGFRIEVAASARADLVKRLTLYRLRTKVAIEPEDVPVFALWDEGDAPRPGLVRDRRFSGEPVWRAYDEAAITDLVEAPAEDLRALRLRSGVVEAEADFPASDVFPHDVLLDQNGGVSFKKGCYVGQEVVSRMQHRGTARRRLMLVSGERHLTPGSDIQASGRAIGTLWSAVGTEGVALVRLDRLVDAMGAGATLAVDGVPVELRLPSWAGFDLPAPGESAATGPEGREA